MVYTSAETYTMSTPAAAKSRQRKKPALTRMNLMVNREDLRKLKELYGVRSESEAVRRAAELVLLADVGERLSKRTAAHGGLEDAYGRTAGTSRLPSDSTEAPAANDIDRGEENLTAAPASRSRR